jgi:hypothetical protein
MKEMGRNCSTQHPDKTTAMQSVEPTKDMVMFSSNMENIFTDMPKAQVVNVNAYVSVLGPPLCLMYTTGLPNSTFADETAVVATDSDPDIA